MLALRLRSLGRFVTWTGATLAVALELPATGCVGASKAGSPMEASASATRTGSPDGAGGSDADDGGLDALGANGPDDCGVPDSFQWSSTGPILGPVSDVSDNLVAIKDPSVVYYGGKWHVFVSTVDAMGNYSMAYLSFTD